MSRRRGEEHAVEGRLKGFPVPSGAHDTTASVATMPGSRSDADLRGERRSGWARVGGGGCVTGRIGFRLRDCLYIIDTRSKPSNRE